MLNWEDYKLLGKLIYNDPKIIKRQLKYAVDKFSTRELIEISKYFMGIFKKYDIEYPYIQKCNDKKSLQIEIKLAYNDLENIDYNNGNYLHLQNENNKYKSILKNELYWNERNKIYEVTNIINITDITRNNKCCIQFNITQKLLKQLSCHDYKKRYIHLRAFNNMNNSNINWNKTNFEIKINNKNYLDNRVSSRIINDEIKSRPKYDLDMTNFISKCLKNNEFLSVQIDIFLSRNYDIQFIIENVRRKSIDEIIYSIIFNTGDQSVDPNILKFQKSCEICSKISNLYKCSICKLIWYCSRIHQKIHWKYHQIYCKPSNKGIILENFNEQLIICNDDEICLSNSIIPLTCPITLSRIDIAAKGINCLHWEGFDIRSFIKLSIQSEIWKCPICSKVLPVEDIRIHTKMNKILKEIDGNIMKIIIKPNGKYVTAISEKETNKYYHNSSIKIDSDTNEAIIID